MNKYKKSIYPREYNVWSGMKRRCLNPTAPNYKNYGGRGIKVSKDWLKFTSFWRDMGPTYKEGLTLERIDVNGSYSKENCKWATAMEQGANRTDNLRLTLNGETHHLHEWARILKINPQTLHQRYAVYGWSEEETLNTPVKKYNYARH